MGKIKKVENIVRSILEDYPDARNSDNILYELVVSKTNPDVLHMPFKDYLIYFKDYNLPRFETVARCRRKLQEQEPHLRSVEDVRKWRKENETEFRNYARDVKGE